MGFWRHNTADHSWLFSLVSAWRIFESSRKNECKLASGIRRASVKDSTPLGYVLKYRILKMLYGLKGRLVIVLSRFDQLERLSQ